MFCYGNWDLLQKVLILSSDCIPSTLHFHRFWINILYWKYVLEMVQNFFVDTLDTLWHTHEIFKILE